MAIVENKDGYLRYSADRMLIIRSIMKQKVKNFVNDSSRKRFESKESLV